MNEATFKALEREVLRSRSLTNKLLLGLLRHYVSPESPFRTLPHYNVLKLSLDTVRAAPGEEISVPGDIVTAYCSGPYEGIYIRMDDSTKDAVPLAEFNPIRYSAGFKKFYVETPAQLQTGNYLRLYIGRAAGAEAMAEGTTVSSPKNRSAFTTGQKDVTAAGTAEQLDTLTIPDGFSLVVKAKKGNVGDIHLGNSKANAEDGTVCFVLDADQSVELMVTNANLVWIDATVGGEGIEYIVES